MKEKAVVVFSGGQDSTTVLFHALQHHDEITCITFNYGQRHAREIDAASKVCDIAHRVYPDTMLLHLLINVDKGVLIGTSPLVNGQENLEQYKDWQVLPGGIEKTFVPMRNQLFLTIAANRAVALGASVIYTGVSQEDYGGYPDCRISYINALCYAINESLAGVAKLRIATPLMHRSKADTVRMAKNIRGCWDALAYSHTAYDGQYPPIGNDHATLLRAKGFFEADEPDPLVLRAVREGLMCLPTTSNYTATARQYDEEYQYSRDL